MTLPPQPPSAEVVEPGAVARWLDVEVDWVLRAIRDDGLPVLGFRGDGTPLVSVAEVRSWLRRPQAADDET